MLKMWGILVFFSENRHSRNKLETNYVKRFSYHLKKGKIASSRINQALTDAKRSFK